MFIDEATISVKGGNGGNGVATFFPGIKTGPSGGDGGNGGRVYVQGDKNMIDLHRYARVTKYAAENGIPGENFRRHGARGEDLILKVPVGTIITDTMNDFVVEVNDSETVHLLVRGGTGGRGNAHFVSSTEQAPRIAKPGKEGQTRHLRLVQRLIADFGLIGLPNAGKSSLLNELTSAKVKTAMYPFTTLEPNLGVFETSVIADIPGLIEGAAQGKGLGTKFLKHVEKVPVLLHCIGADNDSPLETYETIIKEMGQYNETLLQKPHIILLTKTDLISESLMKKKLKELKTLQSTVLPVSIHNPEQFAALQAFLRDAK